MAINTQKINLVRNKAEEWVTIFFFNASVFTILVLIQALILMWFDQFKILYLTFSACISLILTVIFFYYIKKDIKLLPRLSIPVITIISLVFLIFVFFPHDTFGGRDEGLHANLAVYLTNHGSLRTPLHLNAYVPRVESWTGRVPAYTTWLAIQNIFFGQNWMLRSDVILVAFGLAFLYFVASFLGGKKVGLISLILYSSSFPFLWLGRETLSENLAFFLLWASIAFLFTFFKTKRNIYLVCLFVTSWLFSFTRVEGLFIQLLTLLVLISTILITKIASFRKTVFIALIYFVFIGSTFIIFPRISSTTFIGENVSTSSAVVIKSLSSFSTEQFIEQNKDIKLKDKFPIFFVQMLSKYNLFLFLASILLIIPIILIDKKMRVKKKIYFIGLLVIISPEFVKLINPTVSLDQPWLYRRYIYGLIPLGYLCSSILLNKITKRGLLFIIVIASFIINISLSNKIITLKNNWSVTDAIEKIAHDVSPSDAIVIKSYTFLGNYVPLAYLTYQKEIPTFLAEWMEVKNNNWFPKEKTFQGVPYKRLFLISDNESENYKDFKLLKIDSVEVEYKQLQWLCDLALLKKYLSFNINNYSLLPYREVISYCSTPINEILEVNKKIFLYEMIYKNPN